MLTKANERIGVAEYDGLIYDLNPKAEVFAVTIAAAEGKLKRGAVLQIEDDGKMQHMTTGGTASCILADDVDATSEATALAYRTGHFAENKLNVKSGYTLTAKDKEALRSVGILLSDAMEY